MKRCPKCGDKKSETEFWKSSRTRDGLYGWCKDCTRENQRKYHKTDKYKQDSRLRSTRFAKVNRDKTRAAQFIYYAIQAGVIEKPEVADCGHAGNPEAHHYLGYEPRHWIDVIWLCSACHRRVGVELAKANKARKILLEGGIEI